MKRIISTLSALMALLFSASCFGALTCSDGTVKKLVLDISTNEYKNKLLNQAIRDELGTTPRIQGNPTYNDWNRVKDKDKDVGRVISLVDQQVAMAKMRLANIRINGKNDEIKKIECGGDLAFSNGYTHPIIYTAQFTEDGKVYVEVLGL